MRAAILTIACVAALGLSANSAKAGVFDVVIKFPSWGYVYVDPYYGYYSSIYPPFYPPTVITPTPIVVVPRTYVPVITYPRYYPAVPSYPHVHRHHR